jgi:uncharacterized caspase-like protein
VDTVWLFREGRPLGHRSVCRAEGDTTFDVSLEPGINHFEATAVDDQGFASNPAPLEVRATGGARPDVWVTAIGVGDYPNLPRENQLESPPADARAIAEQFAAQSGKGKLFSAAHVTTLLNRDVTTASVLAALDGLAAMKPDDLAIVFLAGHGVKAGDSSDMRFLTSPAALDDRSLQENGIGWQEISDRIARIRGRVVLLLDACHAGHLTQDLVVPNGALAKALTHEGRAGVLVFAASKGREVSLESAKHGFFTQALLDALASAGTDRDGDGLIEMSEAIDAVTMGVARLSEGRQAPWVARRELFGDFAIARAAK